MGAAHPNVYSLDAVDRAVCEKKAHTRAPEGTCVRHLFCEGLS